jgi:hypothetical protein
VLLLFELGLMLARQVLYQLKLLCQALFSVLSLSLSFHFLDSVL